MVRGVSPLVFLAAAGLGLGCFAFEEMDEGMERWTGNSSHPEVPAPDPETPSPTSKRRRVAGWDAVRSLSGDETPTGIVRCSVDGRTQYMRESECIGRGGVPQAAR